MKQFAVGLLCLASALALPNSFSGRADGDVPSSYDLRCGRFTAALVSDCKGIWDKYSSDAGTTAASASSPTGDCTIRGPVNSTLAELASAATQIYIGCVYSTQFDGVPHTSGILVDASGRHYALGTNSSVSAASSF